MVMLPLLDCCDSGYEFLCLGKVIAVCRFLFFSLFGTFVDMALVN